MQLYLLLNEEKTVHSWLAATPPPVSFALVNIVYNSLIVSMKMKIVSEEKQIFRKIATKFKVYLKESNCEPKDEAMQGEI